MGNFASVISKGAKGTDVNINDVAFINETDYVAVGGSVKYSNNDSFEGDFSSTDKAFIKRLTKGSDKAIWTKEYKGEFYSVTTTNTGDIIAVGSSDFYGSGFIIKYSGDGTHLWKKNINAHDVTVDDENNCLVVGMNTISKFDSDGKQLWKKSVNNGYELLSCVQDAEQNYVVIGNYSTGGEGEPYESKAIIAKYSKSGEQLWKKEYKETDDCALYSVKALSDGGVVVVGSINNSVYSNNDDDYSRSGSTDGIIIKYDNDGNIISKIQYDSAAPDECFRDIEIVSLNGKEDIIIAVGESYDMDKEEGEVLINKSSKALIVVFDGDKVLYENTLTGYDVSRFKAISLYNNDWKNCVLIGSIFDDKGRKGGTPFELLYGGYQGLLMLK